MNRLSQQARQYASAAAATAETTSTPSAQHIPPVTTSKAARKAYRVLASPVISRPPLITRDLTSFEQAYFLYQKRLNERLALPFSRYFYYKKGTPADVEWKRKAKNRKTAARDIGVYSGYGDEAWNDEVMIGDETGSTDAQREALIRDAEGREILAAEAVGDKEANKEAVTGDAKLGEGSKKDLELQVQRPMPRVTEADKANDTLSLNRKLDQTLYLVVKDKDGRWRFPEDRLYAGENLLQVCHDLPHSIQRTHTDPTLPKAAERTIIQSAGVNMNTWIVGNHPVGHYQYDYQNPSVRTLTHHEVAPEEAASVPAVQKTTQLELGEKVFFMKVRIMAGQADLSKNLFGLQEFKWLSKGEIEGVVTRKYWSDVKGMLMDR